MSLDIVAAPANACRGRQTEGNSDDGAQQLGWSGGTESNPGLVVVNLGMRH